MKGEPSAGIQKKIGRKVLVGLLLAAVAFAAYSVLSRFAHSRRAKPVDRSRVRIEVVNGSGVNRVGRRATNHLRGLGFDVRDISDTIAVFEKTEIVEHTDRRGRNGREVARALKFRGEVRELIDSTLFKDVTVIVGKNYRRFIPDTGLVF